MTIQNSRMIWIGHTNYPNDHSNLQNIIQTSQNENSKCPHENSKCPNDLKSKNESKKETFIINEYIYTINYKIHIFLK